MALIRGPGGQWFGHRYEVSLVRLALPDGHPERIVTLDTVVDPPVRHPILLSVPSQRRTDYMGPLGVRIRRIATGTQDGPVSAVVTVRFRRGV